MQMRFLCSNSRIYMIPKQISRQICINASLKFKISYWSQLNTKILQKKHDSMARHKNPAEMHSSMARHTGVLVLSKLFATDAVLQQTHANMVECRNWVGERIQERSRISPVSGTYHRTPHLQGWHGHVELQRWSASSSTPLHQRSMVPHDRRTGTSARRMHLPLQ
jgi:hypothetical protein